jgi:hypothetical protein
MHTVALCPIKNSDLTRHTKETQEKRGLPKRRQFIYAAHA